jgi:hypothetical protein
MSEKPLLDRPDVDPAACELLDYLGKMHASYATKARRAKRWRTTPEAQVEGLEVIAELFWQRYCVVAPLLGKESSLDSPPPVG